LVNSETKPDVAFSCPRCHTVYFQEQECDWCDVMTIADVPDDTVKESER
jgi:hypothetical protein